MTPAPSPLKCYDCEWPYPKEVVKAVNAYPLMGELVQMLDAICAGDFLHGQYQKDAEALLEKARAVRGGEII